MKNCLLQVTQRVLLCCLFWLSFHQLQAKNLPPALPSHTIKNAAPKFIVTNVGDLDFFVAPTGTGCTAFDQQPEATATCANQTAEFSVVAGSDFPAPVTYQWESSTDNLNFDPIADGTVFSNTQTSVLTINDVTNLEDYFFRAVVNGADCDNTSDAAQLTVHPVPIGQAPAQKVCSGESLVLNFSDFITNNVTSSFTWEVTQVNGSVSGLQLGQTGNSNINQVLENTGSSSATLVITVTPTAANTNCEGTPFTVNVTVHPIQLPAITGASKVCAASSTDYAIDDVGSAYEWTISGGGSFTSATNGNSVTVNWDNNASGNYTLSVVVTLPGDCSNTQTFTVNAATTPQVMAEATDISCFGETDGTATVKINGAAPSPTTDISWSNQATTASISNLGAATYTVQITTENNCTASAQATVTEPSVLALQIDKTDISCNGQTDGSAMAQVSGGTVANGYQYSWSNSSTTANISNLAANTYQLTVKDDNNCVTSSSTTINEPTALSLQINKTDISCNGLTDGTAIAVVSGGTVANGYQYAWSNNNTTSSLSNLAANTYQLTVKDDNNCSIGGSTTIVEPTALSVQLTKTNVRCFGDADGSITASVMGGTVASDYQYSWSNNSTTATINNLSPNTYQLTVKDDNNCSINDSETITQPTQLAISGTATPATCPTSSDGSIMTTTTGGTSGYHYEWKNSAGNVVGQQANLTNIGGGTYTLLVTDGNNCTQSQSYTVMDEDTTPPTFDCQVAAEYVLNANGQVTIAATSIVSNAQDNCGVGTIAFNNGQANLILDCADAGQQLITVVVEDVNGNQATCTKSINVVDKTAPSINCPNGFMQVPLNANGTTSITIDQLGVTVDDNCDIASLTFADGSTQRNFSCADADQIYGLTVLATDNFGNVNTCVRQVIILDLVAPVLNCSSQPINVPLDQQDAVTLRVADLATASDNCGETTLTFANGTTSRTLRCDNIEGLTQIEIVATDAAGNQQSCSRPLNIVDRDPPTIDCRSNRLYVASLGSSGSRTIRATDLIGAVADDCAITSIEFTDGDTEKTFTCNNITPQNFGFHALTVVVRDNGVEIASCTRLVLVLDTDGVCP